MLPNVQIKIDPFHKKAEIEPYDIFDPDMRELKELFDKVADAFEDCFQVNVEVDALNSRVVAGLVGSDETATVGYSMVGFRVSQILYAVRMLAENVGLFQWDIIVRAGEVIYSRNREKGEEGKNG